MEKSSNREVISRIRGLFKLQNSDTYANISDRAILSELQSTTLQEVKRVTDKRKLWNSPNLFQVIPCLKLQQVPLAECCGYQSNCTIARSIVKLPRIAEGTNFGMLIQGIYSIDTVSRRFIESTPDRYVNSLNLGLKNKQIHYWIWENYLYIGDDKIERIKISAYFEEDIPEDLISYPNYCGVELSKGCCPSSDEVNSINDQDACCPPNPYDQQCSCPGYLLDSVINQVAQRILTTYKRSQADETTNSEDQTK